MDRLKFVREKLPLCDVRIGRNEGLLITAKTVNTSGLTVRKWRRAAGLPGHKDALAELTLLWSYAHWSYDSDPSEFRADPNYETELYGYWKEHAVKHNMAVTPFADADVALSFLVWLIQHFEDDDSVSLPEESNYMMERNARHWGGDPFELNAFRADHDATEQFIATQKAAAEAAEEAERQRRLNTLDDWDLLPDAEPENSIVTRPK